MTTLFKKLRMPVTLLLVLIVLIPLFQNIKVFATYETIYYEDFEDGPGIWSMPYGGTLSWADEASSHGDYSLKTINRKNHGSFRQRISIH